MGRNGKEDYNPAGAVGYGGVLGTFQHQGCLRCPPFSQDLQPVGWQRPHPVMLSNSSTTETHPGGLADQSYPRPVCLAAPPGAKGSCSSAGHVTDECQWPSTDVSSHWQATVFVREVEGQACGLYAPYTSPCHHISCTTSLHLRDRAALFQASVLAP